MTFKRLKNRSFAFLVGCLLLTNIVRSQELKTIEIDTTQSHIIKKGASGFNVRIADKVWNYTHPDFIEVVKELKPGWLRYFSGTMGDAFSSATGQYDLDYIAMFDHPKPFLKGYNYVETKGPHRITDLYQLLSEVNGKLVVTINAFSETPQMTLELARFCKNNNIKVETWQFCNEPYFYVPNRNRYWWNDGYDYAAKMKPHAEAIQQIFPEAKLALNYTWDGVWTFMKEINQYQKENGAYWNVFSKHSYAPHTGKKETLEQAYQRANTKLLEATSSKAMEDIERYTWKGVPMVITEFGVWNSPLNGVYESIYNIEYTMRQLDHTNTELVGVHEISSKYTPLHPNHKIIENAFEQNLEIDTDTIHTGIRRNLEGKAYKIYHEATNNSELLYQTSIVDNIKVPGLKNTEENGMFAQTYKGDNGYNYLVITNRSGVSNQYQINVNGTELKTDLRTSYFSGDSLAAKDADLLETDSKNGMVTVEPYSVSVSKWKTETYKLQQPKIYKATIEKEGVLLTWGEVLNATAYKVFYGTNLSELNKVSSETRENSVLIKNLNLEKNYFFKVQAVNLKQKSTLSESISAGYKLPNQPKIFKVARRDDAVTLFWQSVPNATSYLINYVDEKGNEIEINANNVYGYKIKGLKNNTTYDFTVTAYNGLGKGIASKKESVMVSSRIPLSPRNVSAVKKEETTIEVKWFAQEKVLSNTFYNVYRGEKLHEFTKIASGIKDTVYVDSSINNNTQYYYTVKAATEAGESNFYPNIATTFALENKNKLNIQYVQAQNDGYMVRVNLNKMKLESKDSYGVIINNVSYLNVEDLKISGILDHEKKQSFDVFIPNAKVKENSNYAIKAFVIRNHKKIESTIVNQYIPKR